MCIRDRADVGRAALRCSAALPAVRGAMQSSSSFGIGCRVGCRPSKIHPCRRTGGRRSKNTGSILRPFLPADSASMSSERAEEMKCIQWRGDEECVKIFFRPRFYALARIADWLAVSTTGTGEQMFAYHCRHSIYRIFYCFLE